jgi:dTDP-4-dehydrorhamnose reductase
MKKIVIIGHTGLVGSRIKELLASDHQLITPSENDLNLLDKSSLSIFFKKHQPSTVINLAAYTDVNQAEEQTGDKEALCWQVNVEGVNNLLKTITKDTQLIHISTDMVFAGGQDDPGPYKETHSLPNSPDQLTWYGWTKNRADVLVKKAGHTIVRIIYPVRSSFQRPDYLRFPLRKYRDEGSLYPLFSDQTLNITFIDKLAKVLSTIIDKNIKNDVFHISSSNTGTALEIISTIFKKLEIKDLDIKPCLLKDYLAKQKNPHRYLLHGGLDVSSTEKRLGIKFSTWQEIIDKLISQGLTLENA